VRRWCGFKEGRITVWNEVGAHIWSRVIWKKKWMHKWGKTLHQVISTCFSTSRRFCPPRVWVTKREMVLCRTGWKTWWQWVCFYYGGM
jgi:hypothetical protein